MNRTYVSPGVYTYETELRATYQNLGITSAAIVGETLKGAAFQPMKVSNYNEFVALFGGQNATLMSDSSGQFKYPKYEAAYMAKSYLEKANSLYVTRILGLSGYDAGSAFIITVNDIPVAILRSRGKFTTTLEFDATSVTATALTGMDLTITIDTVVYTVSLDSRSSNYIVKVFGRNNNDGKTPIFVESIYETIIKSLFVEDEEATIAMVSNTSYKDYYSQYQPSVTPWIVSQETSGMVENLFRFITISDGATSSTEVKFSIVDINYETKTFSVLVRDFNDTDASPVIRERFTRCNLNEQSKDFIGRKIGTSDGKYSVRSKFIVVELNEGVNIAEFTPSGFSGIPTITVGDTLTIPYKTKYEPMDNKRKVFLGISSSIGFDSDLLNYLGNGAVEYTNGFNLSAENETLTINGEEFNFSITDPIANVADRKFTVVAYGGFDGWNIYRTFRTNEDNFAINQFYTTTGLDEAALLALGLKPYTMTNGEQGSTADYYAYLEGVRTFANPEDTNINVMTVGGLDYGKNASILNEVVEIVEQERADSIFIMNSPNVETEDEAVALLEDSGIISSYTATYFPWKQYNDSENGIYVNIPTTMDVLRNIAMVDKKRVPWYAVAGMERGDVKCVKALKKLTNTQRDILYNGKVNPIQTWANQGVKIWGNRTLHPDSDAALSSLNVRRLILEARKLIAAASLKLVFDQNDMLIRSQFINLVNPILENMRKERGLTEFRVEVDYSVESIQRKELNARILIKPTPALEFIIIEFGVTDQGVSFDDV